jgi:hypothetical protein
VVSESLLLLNSTIRARYLYDVKYRFPFPTFYRFQFGKRWSCSAFFEKNRERLVVDSGKQVHAKKMCNEIDPLNYVTGSHSLAYNIRKSTRYVIAYAS